MATSKNSNWPRNYDNFVKAAADVLDRIDFDFVEIDHIIKIANVYAILALAEATAQKEK